MERTERTAFCSHSSPALADPYIDQQRGSLPFTAVSTTQTLKRVTTDSNMDVGQIPGTEQQTH